MPVKFCDPTDYRRYFRLIFLSLQMKRRRASAHPLIIPCLVSQQFYYICKCNSTKATVIDLKFTIKKFHLDKNDHKLQLSIHKKQSSVQNRIKVSNRNDKVIVFVPFNKNVQQ